MLLRAYRITDRFGLIFVKLLTLVFDTLVLALRGGVGGVLSLVVTLFKLSYFAVKQVALLVWRIIKLIVNAIVWLAQKIWLVIIGVAGLGARGVKQTQQRATSSATEAMARRVARQQIDVRVAEDPLKVQNRRLSVAVLLMGFLVVGAVLWATDPSRSNSTPLVAGNTNPLQVLSSNATPDSTAESSSPNLGLPTPIPVASQVPLALRGGGTIAYTVREGGQSDIWLVGVNNRTPIRIVNDPSDERDPSWSRDGTRLAYASHRDGNWEIYVYDLPTQETVRITFDLSFQANPRWSPDGLFLTYESYQGNNLDVYAVPIDGSAPATRITDNPAPDYAPVWSEPDGRRIAFVSVRDGNQDIYIFDLNTQEVTNLTETPLRNEDNPSWSRDGRFISYSAWDGGSEKIFVRPVAGGTEQVINFGRTPSWSPEGDSVTFAIDALDGSQTYIYAIPYGTGGAVATEVLSVPFGATDPTWSEQTIPPALLNSGGLPLGVDEDLFVEQAQESNTGAPFRLSTLLDVQAPRSVLSDVVNDSFNAMRARVFNQSGVDFLGTLDDAFWDLERLPSPGEPRRSWHMTGRGVAFQRNNLLGFPPAIEIVREDIGTETYWRIFIRVDEEAQSGQLGEPLRTLPWDFLSATQGDVEAFNQGGRLRPEIPSGYYVDLTQIAQDYGWIRLPSGTDWRANTATRNFWMLIKPEGLDWCGAMLQIYTEGEMSNFCGANS
jgi:TolB protein